MVSNPVSMFTRIRGIEKQSYGNFKLFSLSRDLTHDTLAIHNTQKRWYLILYQCLLELEALRNKAMGTFKLFGLSRDLTHDTLAIHNTQKRWYLILYQCLLELEALRNKAMGTLNYLA